MSHRFVLALAALAAACDVPTINERPPAIGPRRAPDRLPPVSVHGGTITRVAITERADAALSFDTIGDARLWPTLDGTREPVQLELGPTRQASIAHAGSDEFLIGTIDAANNAAIVRVSRDGAIRGHVAIPGELAVTQLATIDGSVILVRADQSIERYDANGALRGKLVGDAGDRFGALAVRGNGAAVLVANPADPQRPPPPVQRVGRATLESENDIFGDTPPPTNPGPFASDVRFIVLGDELGAGLSWGPRRVLATPAELSELALSPDHRKLAMIDPNRGNVVVIDAATTKPIGDPVPLSASTPTEIGFADNDDLAVINITLEWWPEGKPDTSHRATTNGAIGDHLVIAGVGTSLAVATREHYQYLGWSDGANGALSAIGSGFALGAHGAIKLLDDRLQAVHDVQLAATNISSDPIWIDAAHALFERPIDGRVQAVIVDLAHLDEPIVLGSYDYVVSISYEPSVHQVAVIDETGVNRFAIDPNTYAATKLPVLRGGATQVRLLDPATAGGLVAIGLSNTYRGTFTHAAWRVAETTASDTVFESTMLLGATADGTIYTYGNGELSSIHGRDARVLAKTSELQRAAISDDGSTIAVTDNANVMVYDSSGRQRWRHELWQPEAIAISQDRRRVAVASRGGLVEFDAASGERIATACAFGFGLHDAVLLQRSNDEPTVCEDSP